MNRPWKLILLLAGIFLAGVITGAVVDRRVMLGPKPAKEHRSTVAVEQWAPKHLKRLEDGLDLSAAQAEAVRPIIRRNMEELDRLRTYSRSETSNIFERMEREVSEKLTPEQRAKFEQMNKENRERMKKNEPRDATSNGARPPKDGESPPPPPAKSGEPKK
jgi:Spy/CpxP family protein refolding chaperone